MKDKILTFSLVTLGSMLMLMLIGSFSVKADDSVLPKDAKSYVSQFCFEGKTDTMDSADLANAYTNKTNDHFNKNIEIMMTQPGVEIPTPDLGRYSEGSVKLCGEDNSNNPIDMTCRAISICLSPNLISEKLPAGSTITSNPSPYCVGAIALGFTPERYEQLAKQYSSFAENLKGQTQLKYSYFCYKAALELKREDLVDGTPLGILRKCDTNKEFSDKTAICKTKAEWEKETDPTRKKMLEQKIASGFASAGFLSTSQNVAEGLMGTFGIPSAARSAVERVKFVDEELTRAKQALDQTLEAYSQLRLAWVMHVNYVDIFSELVKYRDKVVSIRRQTDDFPFKFIDATTTHCL